MKKRLFLSIMVLVLGSGICGFSLLNSMAEVSDSPKMVLYYKSIEIKSGDTLWNIAEEYAPNTGLSTAEYVVQLKNINHLDKDTIHAGRNLMVMYPVFTE